MTASSQPGGASQEAHPEVALAYEEELATYSRMLRAMARKTTYWRSVARRLSQGDGR